MLENIVANGSKSEGGEMALDRLAPPHLPGSDSERLISTTHFVPPLSLVTSYLDKTKAHAMSEILQTLVSKQCIREMHVGKKCVLFSSISGSEKERRVQAGQ